VHSCLENREFYHPFPKIEGEHEHNLPYKLLIEIHVYCVCRMPYFGSDDKVRELQVAECDQCHQWYHRSCIDYVFKQQVNYS